MVEGHSHSHHGPAIAVVYLSQVSALSFGLFCVANPLQFLGKGSEFPIFPLQFLWPFGLVVTS